MEIESDCVPCLMRQTHEVSQRFARSEDDHKRVLERALHAVSVVGLDKTPVHVAAAVHAAVRDELGLADPYRDLKDESTELAKRLLAHFESEVINAEDPFEAALRFAIAANVIDFAVGTTDQGTRDALEEASQQRLPSSVVERLRRAIDSAEDILYLGDNAGEVVFDRLVIERMPTARTTFVVRGGPIINDATRVDAEAAGLHDLVEIVDNGSVAPGTILEACSPEFQDRFRKADLIIAKGQGNYESLSSDPAPIFFLFKAKCAIVASRVGCDLGDLVIVGPATDN